MTDESDESSTDESALEFISDHSSQSSHGTGSDNKDVVTVPVSEALPDLTDTPRSQGTPKISDKGKKKDSARLSMEQNFEVSH